MQAIAQDSAALPVKKLKIVKFSIHEEIAPKATRKTMRAFEEAERVKADLIILDLNTYGGLVSDADSIRTRILNSKIPVYVFIENNAASAGALISIACNKIFMRKGATIGAATVVNESGEKVPDKYQSYMRSKMRATAEARGRNPDIAQAMVDGDIVVPGVNDSGKIVTLTTTEAIKHRFCDGEAETVEEMLKQAGVKEYDIVEVQDTAMDGIMGFLMHPGTSGVLILLIFLGIYYEL
ncbi:MAG: nodulation protein NfeD, partial [Bacteroidetes bacterium]